MVQSMKYPEKDRISAAQVRLNAFAIKSRYSSAAIFMIIPGKA